jgi:23S rRNA A2030 N6-methylase RlmJ
MFNPMDFFPTFVSAPTEPVHVSNIEIDPNAGNFQEYTYELEYMEAHWNHVYRCIDLVTAYWYPWVDRSALQKMYPDLNN